MVDFHLLHDIRALLGKGQRDEAAAKLEEAAAEAADNPYVTIGRSIVYRFDCRFEDALTEATSAREAAQAADDKLAEAYSLCAQADALGMLDRDEESLKAAEAAGKLAREIGNKLAQANSLRARANALLMLDRYEESLKAAEAAGKLAREIGDKRAEANSLGTQANALRMLGRYEESLKAAEAAGKLAREIGDKLAQADSLRARANALLMLDRDEESLKAAQAAGKLAREIGDKLAQANSLGTQADALGMLGRYEDSLKAAEAAGKLAREIGAKLAEANSLDTQAEALRMLDRYEDSIKAGKAAGKLAREIGNKLAEAHSLRAQADALGMLDRDEESLKAAQAAGKLAREIGDKLAEANSLQSQANALRMLDRDEDSLKAAEAAGKLAREIGNKLAEANSLRAQADALRMLGRHEESFKAAEAAGKLAREIGNKLAEANSLRAQADALGMLDRDEESLKAAQAAGKLAREIGDKLAEANSLDTQAEALRMLGRYEESLTAAEAAGNLAREISDKLAEANSQATVVLALSELGKKEDRDRELEKLELLDADRAEALRSYPVRPGWKATMRGIYKEKVDSEEELREVFTADPTSPPLPEGYLGHFHVLRTWASYTTVELMRPLDGEVAAIRGATGGGYFLWWDGWGLVIDPGLGFGEVFRTAKYVPRNISAVAATHHHIDHTGDMLPIVTCVFEMNQDLPAGVDPPDPVDFLLAPGAFSAFADVAAFVEGIRSVQLLRRNESVDLPPTGPPKATITGVKAWHRDLTGRDDAAIGLRIELKGKKKSTCTIGITGDTRHFDGVGEPFKNVDLLVVHIGSVYPGDSGERETASKSRPWHLGFSGVVRLLEEAKNASSDGWDPLVLISEWGEELNHARSLICEAAAEATGIRRVFPAEYLQSVAIKPGDARPVCARGDRKPATRWHVLRDDRIDYLCDNHDHKVEET